MDILSRGLGPECPAKSTSATNMFRRFWNRIRPSGTRATSAVELAALKRAPVWSLDRDTVILTAAYSARAVPEALKKNFPAEAGPAMKS